MNVFEKTFSLAASGMDAQTKRLQTVGENLANADTPGYRRKVVSFEASYGNEGLSGPGGADAPQLVKPGETILSNKPFSETYAPFHPLADERGILEGSNVNTMIELADASEAGRSYEANLSMFNQARRMYSSLLDLIRR
ncbi:MAG: flagellar basal body rod C-terminal domain-containing protein [Pseudomonadota bacterium]